MRATLRRIPWLLTPAARSYLWGGSRLNDDFAKNIPLSPLAETWECSSHPNGQSLLEGVPLGEVLREQPHLLGTHPLATMEGRGELPILVKLIDAREDLSVQVHPDDGYARVHEGSLGKTEMWYVLDARPGATLTVGFAQDMTRESVLASLRRGDIVRYLNRVPVERGDVFLIEAGTVHAIGAGCLIAEVQESSDLTYRLYDYDRVDKEGRKRPLAVGKALEVARLSGSSSPRQPMRVLRYERGCARELLARCRYFLVERLLINTEVKRDLIGYQTRENSFHCLLCTMGCGVMLGEGFSLNFFKGDCFFVPAASEPFRLHGKAELLDISC